MYLNRDIYRNDVQTRLTLPGAGPAKPQGRTDRTLPADTLGAIVQIDVPEYAGVDFRIVRVYSDGLETEKRDLRSDSHAL